MNVWQFRLYKINFNDLWNSLTTFRTLHNQNWTREIIFVLNFTWQLKTPPHQSGVLTAFQQRSKMQIADVRDVKSTATLCAHCVRAVQSPRTPCDGVYFEHAIKSPCHTKRRCHSVCTLFCEQSDLTTVKYCDELVQKVKMDHYVRKIGLPKIWKKRIKS